MINSLIKQSKSQDSFTTKSTSPLPADVQQCYSDYMQRRTPKKRRTKAPREVPVVRGELQAGVVGDLVAEAGGAVMNNLVQSVKDTIIGGDNGRKNNDRPGVGLLDPVIQFGSFGLLTGKGNTGIDYGIQNIGYSRAMKTRIQHYSYDQFLRRTFLFSTFTQTPNDDRGAVLYTLPINSNMIPTSHIPNMAAFRMPFSALAGFFSYYKLEMRLTFTPVATVFDRTTIVIAMAYGTEQSPTLEQASNQESRTLEIDGSGSSSSIDISYVSQYPVLRVPQGEGSEEWDSENIGMITASVVTVLTSNSGVVNPEVRYMVSATVLSYDLMCPSQSTNTELLCDPRTLKNPPMLVRAPRPIDDEYIPRVGGRMQSQDEKVPTVYGRLQSSADTGAGISDGNQLTGTIKTTSVVNSASVGGPMVPTYAAMMQRSNIVSPSLQIDQFTEIGPLQICSFWDLCSRQARLAMKDFMYMTFTPGACMKLNVIVQGNPSVKGAFAIAVYPMTTPLEAQKIATSLINISAPEGTSILQLNGTNTIDIEIPLTSMLGGPVRLDRINDRANCPFTVVFYMITPYLGTPDTNPVMVNLRTSVHGAILSTPKLVPNLESSEVVGLVRGKFQSGVIDETGETYALEQKPQSDESVPATTATVPPEDFEKSLLNSMRMVVNKQCPELSTGGQKGVLFPLHVGYSDFISGQEISATTSYPVTKNLSITPGERNTTPQPSGFTTDQCVYMGNLPGVSLLSSYRLVQADITVAIWLNTVSQKTPYVAEVIYDNRVLLGAKYPLPNIDEGPYRQGSISQGYAMCYPGTWTIFNIPFASNFGTALTATSYEDMSTPECCPFVLRISSPLRKGINGGTVTSVPESMGFGPGTNKVLDMDLVEFVMFARLGENTTYSIPFRVPHIWSNPEQPEGKYTDNRPTESIPTILDVKCGVAGAPHWVQVQGDIIENAEKGLYKCTADALPYDPLNPGSYFASRVMQHFYVYTSCLTYAQLNSIFGTSYTPDTVFIGNGMMFQVDTQDNFLQMPSLIDVQILAQDPAAGSLNQALTSDCFLNGGYEFIPPGVLSSYTPSLILNAKVYAIAPWRAAGYIPKPYSDYLVVTDSKDPKATHIVAVDSGVPYQIPGSELFLTDVYDIGGGNRKGLLSGSPFLQIEAKAELPEVVDGKVQSSFDHDALLLADIDIVKGKLQAREEPHASVPVSSSSHQRTSSQKNVVDSSDEEEDETGSDGDEPPIRTRITDCRQAAEQAEHTEEPTRGWFERLSSSWLPKGPLPTLEDSKEESGTHDDALSEAHSLHAPDDIVDNGRNHAQEAFYSDSREQKQAEPPLRNKYEQDERELGEKRKQRSDNLCSRIIDMATSWKRSVCDKSVNLFQKFWAAPSTMIQTMFGELTNLISKASSTAVDGLMGSLIDPITAFKNFFTTHLANVPVFVIVILVVFVVSELCNTDYMKTRVLPWLLAPLAKLVGAVCGSLPIDDVDVYNGWFWDSFRSVRDKFSKGYNYCVGMFRKKKYADNEMGLGEFLDDTSEIPEDVEEVPKETFGTKLSHWISVLVDSFSLHTVQKYLGRAALSAGSTLSLMVWLEKRFTSANRMLDFFGKLAPSWYTYIASKFVSKHSPALIEIHKNLEYLEQAIYAGVGSPFLKDAKELVMRHISEVVRFSNVYGYTLGPVDRQFLDKIIAQAKRLESQLPNDSRASCLRAQPVMLVICGEPGIGKTCFMNWLLARFAQNPSDIARINIMKDSRLESNMYNGQSVAEISELFSTTSKESRDDQIAFIFRYCENSPNVVDSAFTKGEVRFEPFFSASTTNYNWTLPISEVTDISALLRRLLIVKFRVKDSHRDGPNVKIDTANFSHLEAAIVVDAKICDPSKSRVGADREFSWPGATNNNPVRVGREIGTDRVKLSNGVSCNVRMEVMEVVDLVNHCMDAHKRNLNALLSVIRGASVPVDTFARDVDKIFSKDAIRRTTICKALIKTALLEYITYDAAKAAPTVGELLDFILGHKVNMTCYLGYAEGNSVDQRKNYGSMSSKFENSPLKNDNSMDYDRLLPLFGELDRHELGYCLQKLRTVPHADLDNSKVSYHATQMSYDDIVKELIEQNDGEQPFLKQYLLKDLLPDNRNIHQFRIVQKREPDFFGLEKKHDCSSHPDAPCRRQGKWVAVKKSQAYWMEFKERMCAFCSLMSLGRDAVPLPYGALAPENDFEYTIRARPIFNPFSHGFWCRNRAGCDCFKRNAKVGLGSHLAALAGTAMDHPYLTMGLGFLSWRIASNVLTTCRTVKAVMNTMLDTRVEVEPDFEPPRRPYLGGQMRADVHIDRTDPFKLEYVFGFETEDFSIEKIHEIMFQYMKEGAHPSLYTCANDIIERAAQFYDIPQEDLISSFLIYDVVKQQRVSSGLVNILGEAITVDRLKAYVRGIIRFYQEDQKETREYLNSLEEEIGELQSRSGKNRKRAVVRRGRKPALVDGRLQSQPADCYGITKIHEVQRVFEMAQPRVWEIRVKPKNAAVFQRAFGIDVGMRQILIPLHMTASEDATMSGRGDYNPIADTFELITTDSQNRDTIMTVGKSQVSSIRSINGKINIDAGMVDLGNGPGTRKALGLFMRKNDLLERITFSDVLLLAGKTVIKIGQVIIKPDRTTAMERIEGSPLRYIHSGVLLYRSIGIDMTGFCGCPYMARHQGNWWIIGIHSGIQYDLTKYGLEKGEYQVGVLLCQETLEETMPVQGPKVALKSNLPDFFEIGGLNDEVKYNPENRVVEDRAFCSVGSDTKAFQDSYNRRGLEPVAQYAGRCDIPNLVRQKTGIVKSPVAHLTGNGDSYAIAFQGDEKVTSRDMACLGLDRTTYTGSGMPGEAYTIMNDHLRSIIVQNPPSEPIKDYVTLFEVLNGSVATGLTVDFSSILTSQKVFEGTLPFGGVDGSASAGVPGKGFKQRDFLREEIIDNKPCRVLDTATPEGRIAERVLARVLERLNSGETVAMIFRVVLKDEALSISKVKEWLTDVFPDEEYMAKGGKTRIIMCLFFVYNLALKIFMMPVLTYLKSLGVKIGWVTGKNPYSPDFEQIMQEFFSEMYRDSPRSRFLGADVSDQESRIDTNTISGLIGLVDTVYSVQRHVWSHKRGDVWAKYRDSLRLRPGNHNGVARVAAISSTLPSYNVIGNEVFYFCLRNQSGSFLTSFMSTYYTIVSEGYSLLKGHKLALDLVRDSRYAKNHDLTYKNPFSLRSVRFSGDDQVVCYTGELLRLYADANRVLATMPATRRRHYPVPLELDAEASEPRCAGSMLQACSLFYSGLPLADPDHGGNCNFTTFDKTTFLANYMTVNPKLSAILAERGVRVDLFARLQDSSKQKCLNFVRAADGDDLMAPLCQNFNTALELTFTAGPDEFELFRNDLIDMLQCVGVQFPLVTFEQCLDRFVSRDYVLGDEDNIFPIH